MSSKATSPNAATTSTTPTEPPKCPGAVAETGRGRTRRCTSAEPDVAPLAARTSAGSPRLPCSGSHRPPYDCVLTSEDRNAADCRGCVWSAIDVKDACAQIWAYASQVLQGDPCGPRAERGFTEVSG